MLCGCCVELWQCVGVTGAAVRDVGRGNVREYLTISCVSGIIDWCAGLARDTVGKGPVMANRVTLAELRGAVASYADTLAAYGLMTPADAATITVASPYGPVRYVVRDVAADGGRWAHDVPGFEGSGGSGFLTIREGIDRLRQSCRVLNEAGYRAGWGWDSYAAERARATREGL